MRIQNHKFRGLYESKDKKRIILTKNLVKGRSVYGERLFGDYREWDPRKSKLGAAIHKGISQVGIKPDSIVLYLGCASGTTSSHVSDMVGKGGFVYALDFAPRVLRDIVLVCEQRPNMVPVLADASKPETYFHQVGMSDVVFQDIAQKDQVGIFLKNCEIFLKKGGFGLLAVKARSIDVTRKPKEIFRIVRQQLDEKITIVDYKELEPFEKDHALFVCKKK